MFRVRQQFEGPRVDDIPATVDAELARLNLSRAIQPGQSVAVTMGSRGIANIHLVIRAIVQHLERLGAKPFIVPAMGSHGGGTAQGQREIVEGYGVTEDFVGCPIRSSMETVVVCQTAEGIPVHFDKHAFNADHVVVCGRVKPHTGFVGDIESGLMKMMLIGLGKHEGAKIYHRAIADFSFPQIVRSVASHVLARCKVAAGVGIVENGYDETALIRAIAPQEFEEREKELLVLAKKWMPKLPFDQADILIIDEIGKNISGSGMDTNVVGRKFNDHKAADNEYPKIKRIWVRDLTEETHGNAAGIGIAEFCSRRVIEQIDLKITKINCLTGGHPTGAMLPLYYDTEREVFDAALSVIGLTQPPEARVMWIRDTLHLAEVECSAAYWGEAQGRSDLTVLTEPRELAFDEDGNLAPLNGVLAAH
jgi:hypothetical protein